MIRQQLTPNSPYADVVLHASGLASLQYRLTEGGETQEIQSKINMPETIRLVRLGNSFSFWAARAGGPLELAGSVEVPLHDPVYVGLAVCSHDAGVLEEAVISKPSLLEFKEEEERDQPVESRLETISVEGAERRVVYRCRETFRGAQLVAGWKVPAL